MHNCSACGLLLFDSSFLAPTGPCAPNHHADYQKGNKSDCGNEKEGENSNGYCDAVICRSLGGRGERRSWTRCQ